jgi:hypothetical protein
MSNCFFKNPHCAILDRPFVNPLLNRSFSHFAWGNFPTLNTGKTTVKFCIR